MPDFKIPNGWVYEKSDLEQGAWSISDPDLKKVAVIFPHDRAQPIEQGENADLHTRNFGSEQWDWHGTFTFEQAIQRGNYHVANYRRQDRRAHIQRLRKAREKDTGRERE
jgi:hypothetical protein